MKYHLAEAPVRLGTGAFVLLLAVFFAAVDEVT